MCAYVCVEACAHECRCLSRSEETIRLPGVKVIGSYEQPDVGTGNWSGSCKTIVSTGVISPAAKSYFWYLVYSNEVFILQTEHDCILARTQPGRCVIPSSWQFYSFHIFRGLYTAIHGARGNFQVIKMSSKSPKPTSTGHLARQTLLKQKGHLCDIWVWTFWKPEINSQILSFKEKICFLLGCSLGGRVSSPVCIKPCVLSPAPKNACSVVQPQHSGREGWLDCWAWASVVEQMPRMFKVLSSNPRTTKVQKWRAERSPVLGATFLKRR